MNIPGAVWRVCWRVVEWQWGKRGTEKLGGWSKDTNIAVAKPTLPEISPELFPQMVPLLRTLKPGLSARRRRESRGKGDF